MDMNNTYDKDTDNFGDWQEVPMQYSSEYSDKGFWSKIKKHYKSAGRRLIELALTLYYALRDSDTPAWARTIIIGALGYFIFPLDILPDFVPAVGFTDDIASIAVALGAVALHIKDEHKTKARTKVAEFCNNSK
jgi:uncharacterized membrane protein YkvA (DUF1232 family)